MKGNIFPLVAGLGIFCSGLVHAQGVLEIPAPKSTQTGIGIFSGWHCTANRIELQIDNDPPLLAGSRTERVDTLPVCGRSDTGFSLLFNYNRLRSDAFGGAVHHVTALADGQPFASAEFFITHFGVEMLTGRTARYTLPNFPDIGAASSVTWDEDKQNFSITCCVPFGPVISVVGTYYGAFRPGPQNPACGPYSVQPVSKHGSFSVDLVNGEMSFAADFLDGSSCRVGPVAIDPFPGNNLDGYVVGRFSAAASCPDYPGGVVVKVNGDRLVADGGEFCRRGHIVGAR